MWVDHRNEMDMVPIYIKVLNEILDHQNIHLRKQYDKSKQVEKGLAQVNRDRSITGVMAIRYSQDGFDTSNTLVRRVVSATRTLGIVLATDC